MTTELVADVGASAESVRALLEAGAALSKPRMAAGDDAAAFVSLPPDFTLAQAPVLEMPRRPKGVVKLRDAASFIDYFTAHAAPRSRIYGQLDPAKFLAVFDDFYRAEDAEEVAQQADWRGFRAEFVVPPSREWTIWHSVNRKDLGQLSFAEFLQDNLPDVVQPDGASLLEMCLNFEAVQGGKVVATQRLQDGSQNLQFQAENNSSGSVKLPPEITLCIPVFENEPPRELQARLRYRINRDNGAIVLRIELVRSHKVLEAAFRETWAAIARATGETILLGTPE